MIQFAKIYKRWKLFCVFIYFIRQVAIGLVSEWRWWYLGIKKKSGCFFLLFEFFQIFFSFQFWRFQMSSDVLRLILGEISPLDFTEMSKNSWRKGGERRWEEIYIKNWLIDWQRRKEKETKREARKWKWNRNK